jgi:hypothetical protein
MNINTKVTSVVHEKGEYLTVDLFFNNPHVDRFIINIIKKEIILEMHIDTRRALNIENTYEDYMKLLKDLGPTNLEIPEEFKKHWTPKDNDTYYFLNRLGEVVLDTDINSFFQIGILENYNAFPTEELAEKAINLSKLGRLILLWQYANDCLFEPDWLDGIQYKYYIIYDSRDENACYDYSLRQKSNNIHFETSEQVKTFIDMYEAEIKELMNIK